MIQLILHLIGDYVTQSDWMAQNKTKESYPAFVHALVYSSLFILLRPSLTAWLVILGTHFLIDRFRLARYVVWAKNWIAPKGFVVPAWDGQKQQSVPRRNWPWSACTETGYPPNRPAWLAVWLLIVADNTMHLAINYSALRWL